MTGQLTRSARAVIVAAVELAHAEGVGQVREDHLLAAVLRDPAVQPLLGEVSRPGAADAIISDLRRARRRGGLSAVEADALADLGIDLDAVVDRIEAELGEGALEDRRATRRRWAAPVASRHVALVLRAAQRQGLARGDRDLTADHLLLGILAYPGLAAEALASRGVTVGTVSAAIDERGRRSGARG